MLRRLFSLVRIRASGGGRERHGELARVRRPGGSERDHDAGANPALIKATWDLSLARRADS